jgi:hypothetical protein
MSDEPTTPDPKKDRSKPFLITGILLVVILLLVWPIKISRSISLTSFLSQVFPLPAKAAQACR